MDKKQEEIMDILSIFVIVAFIINIIQPFTSFGLANPFQNGLGWGLALMWFLIAQSG